MRHLRWEAWATAVALLIALVYIWVPSPYPMGAFTLLAQPLFFLAFLSYAIKVLRELRKKEVV